MDCTVCEEGFINLHQIPEAEYDAIAASDDPEQGTLKWIKTHEDHDVAICHCCGDGEGWYGEAGIHDESDFGPHGSYAYNGGLPKCS